MAFRIRRFKFLTPFALCLSAFLILSLNLNCSTNPSATQGLSNSADRRGPATRVSDGAQTVLELPALSEYVLNVNQRKKIQDPKAQRAIENYFSFLGFAANSSEAQQYFNRFITSSQQFLFCADQNDWECLERPGRQTALPAHRIETEQDLGVKKEISENLKITGYMTEQYDIKKESQKKMSEMLALKLAKIVKSNSWDLLSMALYGVDDLQDSMQELKDSILEAKKAGTKVQAVFDASLEKGNQVKFEYDGTQELMEQLNSGGAEQARLENPITREIMHNKFLIFKKGAEHVVWTGTANISRTCMGTEENANLALHIENSAIAQIYQLEFNEMFGAKSGLGKFHKQKKPNTPRYLEFRDGHEVRIHFAPTDDAEHRVLIPLILSAQKGDVLRIAMFGNGGIEYVRALQYAAAKGVKIKIAADVKSGVGVGSWFHKNSKPNLYEVNPYARLLDTRDSEKIAFRFSQWSGANHLKAATLTRDAQVQIIVVGSQNWSRNGNDDSDENMLTIRRLDGEVAVGKLFNDHFDKKLWPNSIEKKSAINN